MHAIHPLIVDLTLITIYAGITTLIFRKLKQPIVLGYVLAGIFAGPFLNFLPTVSDKENLTIWADIGVIFLLFGLGLEFSFKKMVNVGKAAMITASANIIFMLFLGYNVGLLLGWSTMDSFFLGSMISMSSTTIIIKAFDDLSIRKQKFTDLVFGVLVVEDIVGILLLVLLPTVALGNSINGAELVFSTMKLVFFLVLCFVIGIYMVPTFLQKITKYLNNEMLLLITVGMCLGMVVLATSSGFSSALGAFIMGSILAETGLIHKIENNLQPLKDFFGAVFFVSVGMMVDPSMFVEYAGPILVITLIVIAGKIIFSCFGFIISGQPLRISMLCSFSLAQVGEFAFIIASLGMALGVLDAMVYPIIVAVSVITTFLTPLMIKSAEPSYKLILKILPRSWVDYISQNTSSVPPSKSEERLWGALFKNYVIRLVLFSIILYSIIVFASLMRPYVQPYFPNYVERIVMTFLTLGLMSPFLKALIGWEVVLPGFLKDKLFFVFGKLNFFKRKKVEKEAEEPTVVSAKAVTSEVAPQEFAHNFFVSNNKLAKIYYKLWISKKSNRLPLIVLTSFRLLLISFFIVTVVHKFLTENPKMTLILVILSIFLLSQSKWLLNQYMKIEAHFLDNLNGSKDSDDGEEKNEEGKEAE